MITIISGTNRINSNTAIYANIIRSTLEEMTNEEVKWIDLAEIPIEWLELKYYKADEMTEGMIKLQDEWLIPAHKFLFVAPEYNGSIPGVLKMFIDVLSIRKKDDTFRNKQVTFVGVATGRAGNLRGIDHMTSIFRHMGAVVVPGELPISKAHTLLDNHKKLIDEDTRHTIKMVLQRFVEF